MTLNNFFFLPFLLIVLAVCWLLQCFIKDETKRKNITSIILIIFSYGFIGCTNYIFGIILFAVSLITYFIPLSIEKSEKYKSLITNSGIAALLITLGVFKYHNFFIDSLRHIIPIEGSIKILLPLGISFYIFSAISYIIDVSRKKYSANHSFIDVFLYMSFFPKLLAGPIVKADKFFNQLSCLSKLNSKNVEIGIQIFFIGLFKKIVLADRLAVFVDDVFYSPTAYDSLTLFWAVISYSLQIYFDFSGYSDMAIGVSKIFGFEFDANFNYPYISKNITEFWKRWHISLSSWLQEYLYYSLGGNRKGKIRTYLNLFLTMLLGGLWHGAAWTFVFWGAIHGFALIIHKLFIQWKINKFGDKNATNNLWTSFSMLLTFIFVTFCWIFFRADSFSNALEVIKGIFENKTGMSHLYSWTLLFVVGILINHLLEIFKPQLNKDSYQGYKTQDLSTVKGLSIFMTFIGLIMFLCYVGDTFFIYGNF